MATVSEKLKQGDLHGAIGLASEAVKADPKKFFQKVSKRFFKIVRARGKSRWKNLCVQVSHNILLLFCFLLILERGSILREKKNLARKSTFGIISL